MAERLLLARVGLAQISVVSAGTMALVGHPIDSSCAIVLREYGANPDSHIGGRLTLDLITSADIILTAQRAHRSTVLQSVPQALRRTFTLREFVRLSENLRKIGNDRGTREALESRVAEVAAQRGKVRLAEPDEDEIVDPFGSSLEATRVCGTQIVEAIDGLIVALGLSTNHTIDYRPQAVGCATTGSVPTNGTPLGLSSGVRRWLTGLRTRNLG